MLFILNYYMFIIQVSLFTEKKWVVSNRYYYTPKNSMDFDLSPIEGKRKDIIFLGFIPDNIVHIFKVWLKETKRSGGVLVGSSIREFFEYYKNYNEKVFNNKTR